MKTLKIIAAVLLLFAFYAFNKAHAEVRLGTGLNCGVPAGDGIWQQDGSPAIFDECGNSFALQYVGKINSWLDYMAGLSYRKGSTITDGQWVTDGCYYSHQRSGGPLVNWHSKPEYECDLRYHTRFIESTSKAFTLAIVPTLRGREWSVFTSFGVSLFDATTKIEWDDTQGVCSYREGGCGTDYHRLKDRSTYMDAGFTYKQVFMTLYYSPNERGGEAPNSGNYGLVAGVRF